MRFLMPASLLVCTQVVARMAAGQQAPSTRAVPPALTAPAPAEDTAAPAGEPGAAATEWWEAPGDRPGTPPGQGPATTAGPAAAASLDASCDECQAPAAAAFMPFATPRAVHRAGVDIGFGYQSTGGVSVSTTTLSMEGEFAIVKRWLSAGLRVGIDTTRVSAGGMSDLRAALRVLSFGVKFSPYDDAHGNAVAIGVSTGIANAHPDGFKTDLVPLTAGFVGSLAPGPARLVASAAYTRGFGVAEGLGDSDVFQWVAQPGVSVSGPHVIALLAEGAIEFHGSGYVNLVDVGAGYVHAGDGFKGAMALVFPVTHWDTRAGVMLLIKAGWEF